LSSNQRQKCGLREVRIISSGRSLHSLSRSKLEYDKLSWSNPERKPRVKVTNHLDKLYELTYSFNKIHEMVKTVPKSVTAVATYAQ
jgi:hypothetical protein